MNRRNLMCAALLACLSQAALAAAELQDRPEWARFFADAKVDGSIVVVDARGPAEAVYVHNRERAARRYSPASTFKIPHSLFALDAGLVRDEFQRIAWDGVKRQLPAWNADQDLRSAMRNSTVWVYEGFARELGSAREAAYMRKIDYGNALATGEQPFWVEGDLAISALEQVAFLQRLYRNRLPLPVEHQRLVKDVMINEAGPDWILRAKTGWTGRIGWWVGWVEWPAGPVFFAMNMDTPHRLADLPKRQAITRDILRSINALPKAP
ncbi:class D beta-lactamase [Delftia tsuruhatensis]|uniref:class D beta-lactamase n=1 Tax=Delftia tsuruhatensis TaxID=180282 RepID=UPI0020909E4F|nr:class D beta-lactamase [Delftia tsuruhatensis]MCO5338697.1 class D beta-lactamase [Delftia tsuruhatensis]MCR4546816.1 class D beta-lactamase [Delftia tsuruhatensis]